MSLAEIKKKLEDIIAYSTENGYFAEKQCYKTALNWIELEEKKIEKQIKEIEKTIDKSETSLNHHHILCGWRNALREVIGK